MQERSERCPAKSLGHLTACSGTPYYVANDASAFGNALWLRMNVHSHDHISHEAAPDGWRALPAIEADRSEDILRTTIWIGIAPAM